jgi:hypothetical protein
MPDTDPLSLGFVPISWRADEIRVTIHDPDVSNEGSAQISLLEDTRPLTPERPAIQAKGQRVVLI